MRLLALAGLLLMPVAWAAEPVGDEAGQRLRIESERRQAEHEFELKLRDCQTRFAVTACVEAAQAARRDKVHGLRRQEEVLDGNERRRRAAERLEVIRQKTEAQARAVPPDRTASAAARPDRSRPENGTTAPASPSAAAPLPAPLTGRSPTAAQQQQAERAAADRAASTRQRRDAALRRQQEQRDKAALAKVPAAPLPVPQAASSPLPAR